MFAFLDLRRAAHRDGQVLELEHGYPCVRVDVAYREDDQLWAEAEPAERLNERSQRGGPLDLGVCRWGVLLGDTPADELGSVRG